MSSAVAVTLCAGRAARGAACSCDAAACLPGRRKTCCTHVCSVSFVALCLRFYFEVKSPVLLLVEEAGRRSRAGLRCGRERCRARRSVWPRFALPCGAAGSRSAAGAKVWPCRAGGGWSPRCALCQNHRGSCTVRGTDGISYLVCLVMQLQYFPNVFL